MIFRVFFVAFCLTLSSKDVLKRLDELEDIKVYKSECRKTRGVKVRNELMENGVMKRMRFIEMCVYVFVYVFVCVCVYVCL